MAARNIKNIVFDLGGVVVGFHPKEFLMKYFCDKKTEDYILINVFQNELWSKLDEGTVTREEADAAFLDQAKKDGYLFEVQATLDDWKSMLRPKNDTVALIKTLKENGYHTYYLSNMPLDLADEFDRYDRFKRLFEGGIMSSKEKLIKPDKRIYQLLLDRYHLEPSETLFCDDNKENAAAAAQVGILGVQFLGAKNFQKLMKGYGVHAYAPREERRLEEKDRRDEKKKQEDEKRKEKKAHSLLKKESRKKTNKPLMRMMKKEVPQEEPDELREH